MLDPLPLGRSVVVDPGTPTPPPWQAAPRLAVRRVDAATADRLAAAWRARETLVVELTPGLGLDDPRRPPADAVDGAQPWEWAVDLDLVGERLHHALWSNAVDGRGGRYRWRWADDAVALGARPLPSDGATGIPRGSTGIPRGSEVGPVGADVRVEDGTPVVCDGGPLDAGLAASLGVAVVHRTMIEHGSLRPFGPSSPVGGRLAPDQWAAVTEPAGSVRVIAPAGSGKTRVLTERVRLLLSEWGLPPTAVTAVAFNVRAAEELRQRLADLPDVRVRTLNALALRLSGARRTIDAAEVRRRLDGLVPLPRRAETDPAAPWIEALSRVRLGMARPDQVADELAGELTDGRRLGEVAAAYRAGLAADDVVDFDEQVVRAVERLLGDPTFRHRSQRHARVLLVDELQDLTPAHVLLLRLLVGPAGAIFAVGDDDQTIYGYAGASPHWLVALDRYFPGARSHALEVNYRCPAPVVAAVGNLLTHNVVRVPKTVRAAVAVRAASPAGPARSSPLTVLPAGVGPAARSAHRVHELVAGGAAPAEIAVLARVHAALVPVQVLLHHRQVPLAGTVDRRFLRRSGVGAALAWLAVAAAPEGSLPGAALREAARRPRRAMRASLLDLVGRQSSVSSLASLARWLDAKGSEGEAAKVRQLHADVLAVRRAAADGTGAVLDLVRAEVGGGLDGTAGALDQWVHGTIASHTDDLDALAELAALQPDPGAFGDWLAGQLDGAVVDPDGVTLASVHAVKGREWPHVVLHHVTEGLLPHRLAADIEEERRVLHVGLTRGRQTVTVVPGRPPSRFLAELDRPAASDGLPPTGPVPEGATAPATVRSRTSRSPSDGSAAKATAPTELWVAAVGAGFDHRGARHTVVAITDVGVRTDRTRSTRPAPPRDGGTVGFGAVVEVDGRRVLLAHPASGEAWERLRAWRKARATADGVPAYVVLDDKALRQVAAALPTAEAALLAVDGIGPVKLERYGDDLLALADELRRRSVDRPPISAADACGRRASGPPPP